MKKRFKAKRRYRLSYFFWLMIIILSLVINNIIIKKISISDILSDKVFIPDIKIDKEELLYKMGINKVITRKVKKVKKVKDEYTFKEIESDKKSIYLYATHDSETYVDSTVLEAKKVFKEYLESNGFNCIMDDTNVTSVIKKNNLNYKDSYKVTRDNIINYPNKEIDLYIDLHRDSFKKSVTTLKYQDKSYAKVMFVIGKKHSTYKSNLNIASALEKIINSKISGLSRGIVSKDHSSFNQDLYPNMILIEVGGQENTMKEVSNTLKLLSDCLKVYFNE